MEEAENRLIPCICLWNKPLSFLEDETGTIALKIVMREMTLADSFDSPCTGR
jgi:hypothetical protein